MNLQTDTKKQTTLSIMPPYSRITLLLAFAAGVTCAPTLENHLSCSSDPVYVGDTGTMTFYFRKDLNMSSDTFIAYVIRTGDTANVVQCDRRSKVTITCDAISPAFQPASITDHTLTLTATAVTAGLTGTYTLWTLVDGATEPPVACNFTVMNSTREIPRQASKDIVVIVVPVVVGIFIVAVVTSIVVLLLKRKKKISFPCLMGKDKEDAGKENKSTEQENLLEENYDGKLWYWTNLLPNEDEKLLEFERNRVEGAFLIRRCTKVPKFYYLTVYYDGKLSRFRLSTSEKGIDFLDTGVSFGTLTDLVTHYRKYDIVNKDEKAYGRLTKPFEKAPEGSWYAGKMERAEQYKILQSEDNDVGSFFIREGITKPNAYTLVVKVNGDREVHGYRISVEDDGYEFCDADGEKLFPSLSALVDHYTDNDIWVHGDNLGRLRKPAKSIPHTVSAEKEGETSLENKTTCTA